MAALILTLILSFVIAGLLWFTLGSRIALAEDSSENDLANLVLYALGALPVTPECDRRSSAHGSALGALPNP